MKKELLVEEDLHRKLDILRAVEKKKSFSDTIEFLYDYYEEREIEETEAGKVILITEKEK
ncbi:MAG: hypothetical protein KAU62_14620 [Candidatus Heimdallarchaeota archaeon]|nr:hypothetical protein [Candidatus Heimdallarchaeota archaeon]MCK4612385.1 hypothetical protein [Candidatus Heimdallarchaeota archaeon]